MSSFFAAKLNGPHPEQAKRVEGRRLSIPPQSGALTMSEFKALVLHERDGKVSAKIERLSETALPDGEVIVDVEYSTLNYKDGLILKGLGRLVRKYPHVPGIDFAGRVAVSTAPEY